MNGYMIRNFGVSIELKSINYRKEVSNGII